MFQYALKALRFCLTTAVVVTLSAPAGAGEFSKARVLGFSANAEHFVFEEYGFSDGHGAPYLALYALDVANDKWLSGTPIRLAGDESEGHALEAKAAEIGGDSLIAFRQASQQALEAKREEARQQAAPVLDPLGPLLPSDLVYFKSPQDLSSDGKNARFTVLGYQTYLTSGPQTQGWKLTLEEKPFPAGENCYGQFKQSMGYKLSLVNEKTGNVRLLHEDSRIPKSRGCVGGYGIEQVHVGQNGRDAYGLAILLRYTGPGFEGPDGRLLAITTTVKR